MFLIDLKQLLLSAFEAAQISLTKIRNMAWEAVILPFAIQEFLYRMRLSYLGHYISMKIFTNVDTSKTLQLCHLIDTVD